MNSERESVNKELAAVHGPARRTVPAATRGEIDPDLFRAACEFGLEGLVSKHRLRPYQSDRSKHWIKVKHMKHRAFDRVREALGR